MSPAAMKIAIVPDSYKGSLTASQAAASIGRGLHRALSNISITEIPMADGGDGTVQAIVDATGGRLLARKVQDPLGRPVRAQFGLTGDGKTAIIEMASASGLTLLTPRERNPMITTTYGTGQLIAAALKLGVRKIIVGIGGSATNDGGTGMARALGVVFKNNRGRRLPEGGGPLRSLGRIDTSQLDARISRTNIEVACDVDNPLTGPKGAARVYSPQKGATPAMVAQLDSGLKNLAKVIKHDLGLDIAKVPGSGAAGGLGAGLMAFLNATLRPGIDIVTDAIQLERRLRGCDLVITGEGRLDGQAVYGKAPIGVARLATRLGIPVIAIGGSLGQDAPKVLREGISAYFSALQEPMDESRLKNEAPRMLADCAEQIGRLIAMKINAPNKLSLRRSTPTSRRKKHV